MLIPPLPPVLLVDPNPRFILDCFFVWFEKENSTRRTGGEGGEISIGRKQSASPSHLVIVGLDLCGRDSSESATRREPATVGAGATPNNDGELPA